VYELELLELKHADAAIRFEAARRLGDTPLAPVTAALIETLGDADVKVQYAAVSSLIKHNDRAALTPLLNLLLGTHDSPLWKLIVMTAGLRLRAGLLDMAEAGDTATADLMAAALDAPGYNSHQRALFLRMLGRTADGRQIERLFAILEGDDHVLRAAAVDALGWLGDARAVPALIAIVGQPADHEAVREVAAEALGKLGQTDAVPHLIAALTDPNEWVRRAAAVALGALGDTRAVEPLSALLQDEDTMVQDAAFESLKQLSSGQYTTVI